MSENPQDATLAGVKMPCGHCDGTGHVHRLVAATGGGQALVPRQCDYCEGARVVPALLGPGVPANRRFVDPWP